MMICLQILKYFPRSIASIYLIMQCRYKYTVKIRMKTVLPQKIWKKKVPYLYEVVTSKSQTYLYTVN